MDSGKTTRKRSRITTENEGRTLRKRTKKSFKEPDSQNSDEAQWWSVQTVLSERHLPGKPTEYKVLWDPHPQTGETYPPSWEPAAHLTADLLAEWKQKSGKSGDQAGGAHVEPRSQADFVPADDSLNTGSISTTTTPNRSGLRRLELTTTSREYSASPASPSTAASSPRRRIDPPNQSQLEPSDPESPDIAENGEVPLRVNNSATAIVQIENHASFPREDYQVGLSQRADLETSQPYLSSQFAEDSLSSQDRRSDPQPFTQPADAKTPKVIPDSQSQGNLGAIESSPVQSFFGSPDLRQQVSALILLFLYHCCCRRKYSRDKPASKQASRTVSKQYSEGNSQSKKLVHKN